MRWRRTLLVVSVILVTPSLSRAGPSPSCQSDDQCPRRTYCEAGRCVRIQRPINLLYLFYRSSDRSFTELMGLYWHQSGESGYRVGFPLYWDFWSADDRRRMLLPFYYDHRTGARRHLILPPLELRWTPGGTGQRLSTLRLWPLLFHSRGEERHSTTLLPLLHYDRVASRRTLILPPLLSFVRTDDEQQQSRGMVAGLFHWSRDHDTLGYGMLPLFWHRRSPDHSLTWVAPLTFHHASGDSRTLLALPLLLHHHDALSSTTLALAPPLYHHRSGDRRRLYLPPVMLYHRSGARWFFTLGPAWLRRSERGAGFGLPPLVADWNDERRWLVLFPALWHHRDALRTTWVAGTAFYHRDRDPQDPHRSLGLLPLYYHLRDGRREIDLAPPLWARWRDRERDHTTWAALGGALIWHRTPTSSAQVAFPLLWRFNDRELGTRSTLLLPLGFHGHSPGWGTLTAVGPGFLHRGPAGWSAGLAPLFFAGRDGERRHLGLLPAFWHQRSPERSFTWVAPLGFHTRHGDSHRLVIAPLLFAGWSPRRRHLVLPPLLWHVRSPVRETWVLGPGYYSRRRAEDGARLDLGLAPLVFYRRNARGHSIAVLPLFHHARSADGSTRRFLSPLFFYERDRAAGRRQWAWLAPLYYQRRDPRLDVDVMPPLFARWVDRERKTRTLVIGGPAVSHESEALRVRTLFPLLWDVTDHQRDRRTTALIPLFYRRRVADGSSVTVVGPAFHHRGPGGWSAGLVPLFFAGRDGEARHRVVFPIFWQLLSPERRITVAGPAIWYRRGEDSLRALLPLALFGQRAGSRFVTLPPLLFHHQRDLDSGARFTLAGPLSLARRSDAVAWSLWPLLHYRRRNGPDGRRASLTLVPLFHFQREPGASALHTPLGGYARDEQRTVAVVGPLYVRRGADRVSAALIPLAWAGWERGGFGRSHHLALLPLFYSARGPGRRALYTPLFGFHHRAEPRRSTWYAGPFIRHRSEARTLTALLPLVLHSRDHLRGRTTLLAGPYFGRWSAEQSTHVLAPLLWHRRRQEGSTTLALPLLWDVHHRGVSRSTLVFPLYLRRRDVARQTTSHLTHLLWLRRHPAGTDVVAFPVLWHFTGRDSSSTVVFPLLWRFQRPGRRSTVVFPLYWDFTRAGTRTTVVLNTLYRRNKARRTYDFHFLPLVRVQRKRPTDIKLSLLAGLFGYERVGRDRFLKLFLVPIDLGR